MYPRPGLALNERQREILGQFSNRPFVRARLDYCRRVLEGRTDLRSIELGAQEGLFSLSLYPQVRDITLVELDVRQCAFAMEHFSDFATYSIKDLYTLRPEEFGRYDVVLAPNIIEHVEDPIGLLRVCRDLVTESGIVIVMTPGILRTGNLLKYFAGRPLGKMNPTHVTEYLPQQIFDFARWVGLQEFSFEDLKPVHSQFLKRAMYSATHAVASRILKLHHLSVGFTFGMAFRRVEIPAVPDHSLTSRDL